MTDTPNQPAAEAARREDRAYLNGFAQACREFEQHLLIFQPTVPASLRMAARYAEMREVHRQNCASWGLKVWNVKEPKL